jgi:hypothetical protein
VPANTRQPKMFSRGRVARHVHSSKLGGHRRSVLNLASDYKQSCSVHLDLDVIICGMPPLEV